MLLEALAPVEPGDSLQGCSYEEAVVAIRGLAKMQARWWNHPNIIDADWLWTFSGSYPPEQWAGIVGKGWKNLPDDYLPNLPDFADSKISGGNWFSEVLVKLESEPLTLCHSDYRLDNLFFDTAGQTSNSPSSTSDG